MRILYIENFENEEDKIKYSMKYKKIMKTDINQLNEDEKAFYNKVNEFRKERIKERNRLKNKKYSEQGYFEKYNNDEEYIKRRRETQNFKNLVKKIYNVDKLGDIENKEEVEKLRSELETSEILKKKKDEREKEREKRLEEKKKKLILENKIMKEKEMLKSKDKLVKINEKIKVLENEKIKLYLKLK